MEASMEETLLSRRPEPKEEQSSAVSEELKRQLWLAGPLIFGFLMRNLIQMISLMFLGHLGELQLAGATMATSFAGFTGFSLLNGLASGLETLCGQAFGARQYHLVCVHKQRGMLILTLLSVPLAVVWFYAGSILLLFGLKDEDIAMEAGTYARWMIPALFAYGLLQCQVRYLQMQNIVFPVMLSAAATVLFHLAVCWVLVHGLGLGSKGVAIGIAISYWINVLILAVYVRVSSTCKNTWTGFSIEAFHDPLVFFRVAVPSALMVCSEWWLFETIILLSGLLPNARLETSVLSITLSTADCLYMIPSGLGAAISTRVSNELGTARPRAARLAVRVAMFFAISEGLVMAMILISVRHVWGHVYSDQEEVVTYVAKMVLLIAVSSLLDGIQSILSGVARGCGWQKIGACINLGAFYIVGIPAAYLFAFGLHIGGMGLWMGIICGILVQDLLLLAITLCTDWEKEATKVKDRVLCSALPTDLTT
ncbi:hypothetical protein QYE76_029677 [Lolium multiflorum]|uniref:Protein DETOXIFICATION n=1 Tax=Lolium multiflorum TaxID=4521 RepID=A0AAD8VGW5_LOLMU|nr:hypothetical protein QYE76_029677 [Lolium multiflorum]